MSMSLVLLLATSAFSASCGTPPYPALRAEAQSQQPPVPSAQITPNAQITLEFDLPDEFSKREADNSYTVTGFRVGVFKPGNPSNPLATVDLTRDQVKVNGRTAEITLDRSRLPANIDSRVLRLQTLTRTTASFWSDPSPRVGGSSKESKQSTESKEPKEPKEAKAGRATPRKREGKQLAIADVERHPRLLEALRKVLPSDVKAEDVAGRFRTVEDLAVSVVLSEEEKIPLDKLSAAIKGPPPRNLRAALREVQPSSQSKAVVQKARQKSKALLDESKK